MPRAERSPDANLPLRCPKCEHDEATLVVHSFTVLTVMCAKCSHSWAADAALLPDNVRQRLRVIDPRS